MTDPWTNGYRHGMEHCLAILSPLLDGDNADIAAVREAVRLLRHQMPQPLEPTADRTEPDTRCNAFLTAGKHCARLMPCELHHRQEVNNSAGTTATYRILVAADPPQHIRTPEPDYHGHHLVGYGTIYWHRHPHTETHADAVAAAQERRIYTQGFADGADHATEKAQNETDQVGHFRPSRSPLPPRFHKPRPFHTVYCAVASCGYRATGMTHAEAQDDLDWHLDAIHNEPIPTDQLPGYHQGYQDGFQQAVIVQTTPGNDHSIRSPALPTPTQAEPTDATALMHNTIAREVGRLWSEQIAERKARRQPVASESPAAGYARLCQHTFQRALQMAEETQG